METIYVAVTILAAAFVGYSAAAVLLHAGWVTQALANYGVAPVWWPWLGIAKAAGALGLLVGLLVTLVGIAAEIALAVYFTGAVLIVLRARWYSHIPYPLVFLAPVAASAALRLAA